MTEGIISLEDREFISSLGRWAGDATWDPGPIGGWTGLAKFIVGVYPDIKTIRLSYPYVNTPKNKQVGFVFYTYLPAGYQTINRRLRITDGVYTFMRDWSYQWQTDRWFSVGLPALLPADWNKQNTTIFLDLQTTGGPNTSLTYADRASLLWVSKKQYLPIMGVG